MIVIFKKEVNQSFNLKIHSSLKRVPADLKLSVFIDDESDVKLVNNSSNCRRV